MKFEEDEQFTAIKKCNKNDNKNDYLSLRNPTLNNINATIQHERYFIFEFELILPKEKLAVDLERIFKKYTSSYIPVSTTVYLLTDIRDVRKFICCFVSQQRKLTIRSYSLFAIEQGYLLSSWLKRI